MQTLRNNIMLVGNMGSAPIITNFENGGKVARFRLATDSKGSKGSKGAKQADWHSVFAWGNIAGFLENYGAKGKQLAIHGRIVDRTYTNKSGEPRKITEVEVKHVIGL